MSQAFLNWDPSTQGFELRFAGEVVLVAATGQFAQSDWQEPAVKMAAPVAAGTYDVLVLSYAQEVPLRFQLELRFREN